MSWLYSRALVEEYLAGTCSDGELSVQSNGNPTQLAYLPQDKMTAFSRLSRSGMTFKPLTESRGEELLTSFLAAFPAKTLAQQERELESKVADQVCGNTWHELSMKYDLDSHSWRTHQCLWDEALQWSLVTLPKWGMTVNGVLFQHPTAERPISATGFGFWPTPAARDGKPTNTMETLMQGRFMGQLANSVKLWATPAARDWKGHTVTANHPQGFNKCLANDVLNWPTPQARDYKGSSGRSMKGEEFDLPTAVKKWPTPCANDNRDRGNLGSPAIQRRQEKGKQIMLSMSVSDTSGALNPLWVEWLMAWPLGWTDLKPLAMDRFQSWQQQHSVSYQESDAA